MYLLWAANGLAQSMLWSAVMRIVSTAYTLTETARKAAMVMSVSVGIGTLLGVLLPTALALLGLAEVFTVPGAIILSMGVLVQLLLRSGKRGIPQAAVPLSPRFDLRIFRDSRLLRMLFPALAHGAIKENLILWIPLFFLNVYGLNLADAAFFIFMMPIATLLGRFLFPLWYRLCKSSGRTTLLSAFAACILLLLPLLLAVASAWISGLLLSGTAICTSIINAQLVSVFPMDFQAENRVSTVAGLLDSISYIGSALGSLLFGLLISQFGYNGMIAAWALLAGGAVVCLVPRGR